MTQQLTNRWNYTECFQGGFKSLLKKYFETISSHEKKNKRKKLSLINYFAYGIYIPGMEIIKIIEIEIIQ